MIGIVIMPLLIFGILHDFPETNFCELEDVTGVGN